MEIIPQLMVILFLVLLNGFFVASEFALVAVRKSRIEAVAARGNTMAKLVASSLKDLDTVISATQLGITISSLALGWVGEPALAHFIEPYFSFLPAPFNTVSAHSISVTIAFSIITFLHIVLGELAPKSIALQQSEKTSLFIIAPLFAFTTVFKPFIWVLNKSGLFVIRLFGFKPDAPHQLAHTQEEIELIVAQSGQSGVIPQDEVEMVQNVFKLGDIPINQVMSPRTGIIAFEVTMTLKSVRKQVEKTVHSRFPIYKHDIDHIIGFIHIKDLYREIVRSSEDKKIFETKLIREIITVPETKRADEVLIDMRKKRIHMAIVLDEYGGTAGLATIEDILESLVGEIQDEFDKPEQYIIRQSDGTFFVDGRTPLEDVLEKFHLPLKGQGYTTVGGLMFGLLGREPKTHDTIQIGAILLEISEMEGKRIKTIQLRKDKKFRSKN